MSEPEAEIAATEADLVIERVSKRFGNVAALSDCSISARPGEILALLGPSGCGKSTLLNLIAGFGTPDSGRIILKGEDITRLPPNRRRTAMVFQSYALFPHLTVRSNITYGLAAQRAPDATRNERLDEVAELFGIGHLLDRYPGELSGGQRQRVAIARAVAIRPRVLLLDEALSALDKVLRERMQVELALLLRKLRTTVIMVTHDQREAFSMADRVAVMDAGRILQVGSGKEIYAEPRTRFVLNFIGSANLVEGEVRSAPEGPVFVSQLGLQVPTRDGEGKTRYIRVEDLNFSGKPTPVHREKPGTVAHVSHLGALVRVVVLFEGGQELVGEIPNPAFDPGITPGSQVYADFPPDRLKIVAGD